MDVGSLFVIFLGVTMANLMIAAHYKDKKQLTKEKIKEILWIYIETLTQVAISIGLEYITGVSMWLFFVLLVILQIVAGFLLHVCNAR